MFNLSAIKSKINIIVYIKVIFDKKTDFIYMTFSDQTGIEVIFLRKLSFSIKIKKLKKNAITRDFQIKPGLQIFKGKLIFFNHFFQKIQKKSQIFYTLLN